MTDDAITPATGSPRGPAPGTGRTGPYAGILQALQLLTPPGGILEVRALNPWTASGYFDADHLPDAAGKIEALDATGTYDGIYIVLNEITPALLSRRANRIETRLPKAAATTADADIIRRRWFPVDIDVKRPSGISSTDEEHAAALEAAGKVARYLSEEHGFPEPIRADSGNGAHLLYRIDLPNDEGSRTLIERCLKALGAAFDRDPSEDQPGWEIDKTTFNAARIWKLYGTVARKGDNTPERPHRRARILEVPETVEPVRIEALAGLAAQAPAEEQPRQEFRPRNGGAPGIDLEDWLREYGASLPPYQAKSKTGFRTFYLFDVCPWDPAHRDKSAFVGQRTDGPLVAGCHHNGCSGNGWTELRALVEPKRPKPTPVRTDARREAAPASAPVAAAREEAVTVAGLCDIAEPTKAGGIRILYPGLAALIHEEMHTISYGERVYVYRDGVYSADKGQIAARIKEILESVEYKGAFSTVRREVLAYLLATDPAYEYPFNWCEWHLSVKNGVLRIDPETYQMELLSHSPEYRFSYKLPVVFDPSANDTFIKQTLSDWVDADEVPYLLQPVAVAILQSWGRAQKQAFLFEGNRDGGKTTYCDFLYAFFGTSGYAQVDLYRLAEDRFAIANLEHRLINIYDEARAVNVKTAESIKNLTGGLSHSIERKHENSYTATISAAHVFCCNKPPRVDEGADDAFWSRWIHVVFGNQFPRDDSFKDRLITQENLSAFLNLVLDVVVAVMRDRNALRRMSADEVRERWNESADETARFLWTHFDRDPTATVPKDDVYGAYVRFCTDTKIGAKAKSTFSMHIGRLGIKGVKPRAGDRRVPAYAGIRWKPDSPYLGPGGPGISSFKSAKKEVQKEVQECINKLPEGRTTRTENPVTPGCGEPTPGMHSGNNGDSPDKGRVPYSPDPDDYSTLGHPQFNQRCAACNTVGVSYRERPLDFNVKRGTAGLCKACFEKLTTEEVRP